MGMVARETSDWLARYLEYLGNLTNATAAVEHFLPFDQGPGQILALTFVGVPEPHFVTGFTYGLSLGENQDRTAPLRELSITVRSDDPEWAKVPARVVAALRGRHPFNRGQALGYAGRFVEESAMNSLVLAEPAILAAGGSTDVESTESRLTGGDNFEIVGAYPIFASERDFIYSAGFDAFWSLEWNRLDPLREPAV
jgi:hypothetical protein